MSDSLDYTFKQYRNKIKELEAENAKLKDVLRSIALIDCEWTADDAREMYELANDALREAKKNDL